MTKVKSRIVLEILRLGYNVLLSDVDIYWFGNPMPLLYSLGLATLGAQSDEYNETGKMFGSHFLMFLPIFFSSQLTPTSEPRVNFNLHDKKFLANVHVAQTSTCKYIYCCLFTGPINLPRRLNSGFYFARSDNATIIAMEMIVKHAASSGLSEQPSFYDVLCGENGTNRIGEDRCLEPNTNLTVVFLDRDLFPNGAYKGLWEKRDVRATCKELGCFIIHNNWINKRRKKVHRQMVSGLWDYDPSSRQCLQEWSAQNDGAIPFV